MKDKFTFITDEFVPLVKGITPGHIPGWGKMNLQQMVEHVTDFFRVSTGKIKFDVITPAEHLPKYKEFLLSEKQFRENTKAPAAVLGEEPLPLRSKSLDDAFHKLEESIKEFENYFKDDHQKTTAHPVFGALNFEEWVLLHFKHITHHLRQFGIAA